MLHRGLKPRGEGRRRERFAVTRLLGAGLAGLLFGATVARAEIRVVGSDFLASTLAPALNDFARRNELKLTIRLDGSRDGWQALQSGDADIGLVSFPPGVETPSEPFHAVPLAYHVVVVLASPDLSVNQVSFAQLAGVFGQDTGPAQRRWSALSVTGDQAAMRIVPRVLAPPHSLVRQLFCHLVLHDAPLRSDATVDTSMAGLGEHMAMGTDGLALAPRMPSDGALLKTLAVSTQPGGVAYAPTAMNVDRGDYPLRWPLFLVFRRAEAKRLYPLLRYLLGDECAGCYRSLSLLPVPAERRSEAVFNLEQL